MQVYTLAYHAPLSMPVLFVLLGAFWCARNVGKRGVLAFTQPLLRLYCLHACLTERSACWLIACVNRLQLAELLHFCQYLNEHTAHRLI